MTRYRLIAFEGNLLFGQFKTLKELKEKIAEEGKDIADFTYVGATALADQKPVSQDRKRASVVSMHAVKKQEPEADSAPKEVISETNAEPQEQTKPKRIRKKANQDKKED